MDSSFALGISGARFMRDGAVVFKYADGGRLRVCAEKQRRFCANPHLAAPRVISVGNTPTGTVFAQEWIDGRFPLAQKPDAARAATAAGAFVVENQGHDDVSVAPLLERLDRVPCGQVLRQAVAARVTALGAVPAGDTHGDLTFCNLIVTDVRVYAIDWANPTIESPLLDAVKLRQDTLHGWAARMTTVDQAAVAQADAQLHALFSHQLRGYTTAWAALSAWSLLCRVFTYARDDETRAWAESEADRCIRCW